MTAFAEVLATVPDAVRDDVARVAHRRLNAVGGRPSDAARTAVAIWRDGRLQKELDTIRLETLSAHRERCQYGPRHCPTCRAYEATQSHVEELGHKGRSWTGR